MLEGSCVNGKYNKKRNQNRKEQFELFEAKENLSIFDFMEKVKIKALLKEYDKAIYRNLLKLDEVTYKEMEFIDNVKINRITKFSHKY